MSHPIEQIRGDDLLSSRHDADLLEALSQATGVLDLLRRADEITPPEIDLWSALVLGDPAELYVHAPGPLSPSLALALGRSMSEELRLYVGKPEHLWPIEPTLTSCTDVGCELVTELSEAYHDHVTERGEEVVAVARASALRRNGLTLDRWRQADEALQVTAWMLGSLTDSEMPARGVIDPISGAYTNAFFRQALDKELARHQRVASELCVILLQLRRTSPMLADQRPAPQVLAAAAQVTLAELRDSDLVARLDSRRLAALLPCTSPRNGLITASRLGEALQDVEELKGWSIDIGVSGVGLDTACSNELLDQATYAMLAAQKGASRHPFVYV